MLIHSRTGKRPRLALLSDPLDPLLRRVLLHAAFYGVLSVLAIKLLSSSIPQLIELLSPNHPIHALGRPVTPQEQAAGVVRTYARAEPRSPTGLAVCLLVHEYYVSGKNGGWKVDWRGIHQPTATVRVADGQRWSFTTALVEFEPEELVDSSPQRAEKWKQLYPRREGRFREQCIEPGQEFFVDGCVRGGELVPCGGQSAVVLTPGRNGPQRRLDLLAARAGACLGALGGVVLLAMLWAARLARASLASVLMERFAAKTPLPWWIAGAMIGLLPVMVSGGLGLAGCGAPRLSDLSVPRAGHGAAALLIAAVLVALLVFTRRLVALGQAVRPILALPAVPLSKAAGELVEVHARVHPRAPTVPGAISGQPRAWWRLIVREVYRHGKNTRTEQVLDRSSDDQMPIMDETAEGALDLSSAHLDVRSVGFAFKPTAQSPEAERVRAMVRARDGHVRFLAEERYLEPSEQVFVLGRVQRVPNEHGESTYRSVASQPLIRGTTQSALIVYAGSERGILGELRRERIAASLVVGACALLALGLIAAELWLVSR